MINNDVESVHSSSNRRMNKHKVKFKNKIRLLVRLDCYQDTWNNEQEWEFDAGEEIEVYDIIFGKPRKFKTGNQKTKLCRFADIFLNQGDEEFKDYIHLVPETSFDIID